MLDQILPGVPVHLCGRITSYNVCYTKLLRITVVQTAHKNTEYNTILAAALSGGAGPDIFQGRAYGGLATFADSGFLEPLEQWMPELKNYSATALLGATNPSDGKIYGSPAVSQTVFMYYNKAIYKELGLSVPKTWDEMIHNFDVAKAAGYIPLGNGAKDGCVITSYSIHYTKLYDR